MKLCHRQPKIAAALLLFAVLCHSVLGLATPSRAAAMGGGQHVVRSIKAPVVVELAAPTLVRLISGEDQWEDELDWARTVIKREMAGNPRRLVTLDLQAPFTYDALPSQDQDFLIERFGQDAPAAYETAMARFLKLALDAAGGSAAPVVSVVGLPIEFGRFHPNADATNQRYSAVISRLAAFTSRKSFVLQGGIRSELDMVRSGMSAAFTLSAGRPIIFRTNDIWRMAYRNDVSDELVEEADREPDTLEPTPLRVSEFPADSGGYEAPRDDDAALHSAEQKPDWSPDDELDDKPSEPWFASGGGGGGGNRLGIGSNLSGSSGGSGSGGSGGGGSGGGGVSGGGGTSNGGTPDDGEDVGDIPPAEAPDDPGGWTPADCDDESYDPWSNIHGFTGLPVTCDGWTDLLAMYQHPARYTDTRIVYVSNSTGNNATGMFYSPASVNVGPDPFNPTGLIFPYKTLAAGYNQLRNGKADMLLLKRGDEWEESFSTGSAGKWTKNGKSADEPIILGTYGGAVARPTLNTGAHDGINCSGVDNLLVTGIKFFAHTWESTGVGKGVDALSGTDGAHNQLHEDCVYLRSDIVRVQGSINAMHANIAFRRCHFISTLDQSLYANCINNLLIEESYFFSSDVGEEDRRFLYLSPAGNADNDLLTGVIVRGNIFFAGKDTGLSIRSGGLIENNLIIMNDQVLVGGWGGSANSIQSATIRNNVFTQSSIGPGDGESSLRLINLDGLVITGNVWTDSTNLGASSYAINFTGSSDLAIVKNAEVSNNVVYGWGGPGFGRALRMHVDFDAVENVSIHNNDFQMISGSDKIIQHNATTAGFDGFSYHANRYFTTDNNGWFFQGGLAAWIAESGETEAQAIQVSYPNANRTLASYSASIGGQATVSAFIDNVLLQSRVTWNEDYTAQAANHFIRAGFGLE